MQMKYRVSFGFFYHFILYADIYFQIGEEPQTEDKESTTEASGHMKKVETRGRKKKVETRGRKKKVLESPPGSPNFLGSPSRVVMPRTKKNPKGSQASSEIYPNSAVQEQSVRRRTDGKDLLAV
jgi:hypothetical protein